MSLSWPTQNEEGWTVAHSGNGCASGTIFTQDGVGFILERQEAFMEISTVSRGKSFFSRFIADTKKIPINDRGPCSSFHKVWPF